MTQMSHNVIAFHNAQPASERESVVTSGQTGLFALMVAAVKRYLAARRTIKALEGLNDAQLKDIGYRRIEGLYSRYEPMP